MYYFTIGAIFKNESHILKEWLDHYFFHGIEHIYLINDHSTDDFMPILQPYLDKECITLYTSVNKIKSGGSPQIAEYNIAFHKHLRETKWFSTLDLDEFLYSPHEIDIKNILKKYENEKEVQIDWVHFGSSGHIKQPESVVSNFLYRANYGQLWSYKSILKTDYKSDIRLGIHCHINPKSKNISHGFHNSRHYNKNLCNEENIDLLLNHYSIQSKEFWMNVKMTRGDVNCYYERTGKSRDLIHFAKHDVNDIKDERLKEQNKNIYQD